MSTERDQAREFVESLRGTLGDGLVSAAVYGSAARGEYRPGTSDINLLVIVQRLGPDELRSVAAPTRGWLERGNPPPLLMSNDEWRRSADVFPIEYSDIRDAHLVVYGDDPCTGIRIDRDHLRLQLEHELRSKKIQLREGLIVAGDSAEETTTLLVRSLSTFVALFRGALRLVGASVPARTREQIEAASAVLGFEAAPVLAVLEAKERGRGGGPVGRDVADGYLRAVLGAAAWLDGYEPPEGAAADV